MGGIQCEVSGSTSGCAAGTLIHAMGHLLIYKCGYFKLWHGGLVDADVSQHLIDWYTPGLVVDGIVIYGIMWLLMRRKPSLGLGLIVSAFLHRSGKYSKTRRSSFTALPFRHVSPTIAVTASSP
jgi:hypothetical protein